jgi:hypothetical protein
MVRNCAPENLEIPGLVLAHHPGMTVELAPPSPSLRAKAKQSRLPREGILDCFVAEPVIKLAKARPGGSSQ